MWRTSSVSRSQRSTQPSLSTTTTPTRWRRFAIAIGTSKPNFETVQPHRTGSNNRWRTRLEFCADEHVPQAAVNALRSNGYEVDAATDAHGTDTIDMDLLMWCDDNDVILLPNDRDFVELPEFLQ